MCDGDAVFHRGGVRFCRCSAECVGAFGNEPSEFVAQSLQNTISPYNDRALVPHLIN